MRRLSLIAIAGVTLLAACGGDAEPPVAGSPENPLRAATPAASSSEAKEPGYEALVERQSSRPARRFSPCTLVTRAQARAIIGAPVEDPVEAPQGPTCIYRSERGDRFVTVAVQDSELAPLRRRLRGSRSVQVAERTAYCGTFGQPMLYLPVDGGRVLSIAAPCKVASGFAATAVRRLAG
jgi:uncharacterized protein DUF3558